MVLVLMNLSNVEIMELSVEQNYEEFKNRNKSEPFLFSSKRQEIEISDISFFKYVKTLDILYVYVK